MKKLIFIGDSITEHGRFQDEEGIGSGYVRLIHDYLQVNYPEKQLHILNKGISGNEVTHLRDRWETDVIQEQADFVSISIGINDAWAQIKQGHFSEKHVEAFTQIYEQLLIDTLNETKAQIILMEPTIITIEKHVDGNKYLQAYVEAVRQLNKKYPSTLVKLYEPFQSYDKEHTAHQLTSDGIHMTTKGSTLLASKWLQTIKDTNIIF